MSGETPRERMTAAQPARPPLPARRGCDFCHLRAELDEALSRVEQLEAALRPATGAPCCALNLTPGETVIVDALYTSKRPQRYETLLDRLDLALGRSADKKTLVVMICRLRKKLAQTEPEIQIALVRHHGYSISEAARARLTTLGAA